MIYVDFETRGTVELKSCGVYRYAESPETDVWCMAWMVDEEEPEIWIEGQPFPPRLEDLILKGNHLHAWNAQFERVIWSWIMTPRHGWPTAPLWQWRCTMARAACMGLPLNMGMAAAALGVDQQKDQQGHNLMMRLCKPRSIGRDGKPVWWTDADRLRRLYDYCKQDVRTERAIHHALPDPPSSETDVYFLDQKINDRGVQVDMDLISAADALSNSALDRANDRLREVTGGVVSSASQVGMMAKWLADKGVFADGVSKPEVTRMLADESIPSDVREMLGIRKEVGLSSVAKLDSMRNYACKDHRMRGMLAYHGAGTGRWAGRGPQPQNFPRGVGMKPEGFIGMVLDALTEDPDLVLDRLDVLVPPMELISSMLRPMMTSGYEKTFYCGDFAAIEARVLAWCAGHKTLLEAFSLGVDPYKLFAAAMDGTTVEDVTKARRQVGKIAILGLGYSMGKVKFVSFASGYGVELTEEEAGRVVQLYRKNNQPIVTLWREMQTAAIAAVENPGERIEVEGTPVAISFRFEGEWLRMSMPSGRCLSYLRPQVNQVETEYGPRKDLTCTGYSSTHKVWGEQRLYGGILVENLVQALSRDLLVNSMFALEAAGYQVVLTVHDEVLAEQNEGEGDLREFEGLMKGLPEWAAGLPMGVDVWKGERYRK